MKLNMKIMRVLLLRKCRGNLLPRAYIEEDENEIYISMGILFLQSLTLCVCVCCVPDCVHV